MTTRIRSLIAVAAVGIGVVGSTSCSPALAGSPKHPSAAGWPVVVTWHDYWVGGERSRQSVSVSSDGTVTINRDGATRTRKLAEPDTAALGALQYDGRLVDELSSEPGSHCADVPAISISVGSYDVSRSACAGFGAGDEPALERLVSVLSPYAPG